MASGISRRTLLQVGALAAVTAGGAVLVSVARDKPHEPNLFFGGDQNLPVADVPAATTKPVEIVFCAGWDARTRKPVGVFSESVARAQHTAGAQYAAVLYVDGTARSVVEVCWSFHHAEVWNLDDAGRPYRGVAYRRWPDDRLRLFEVRSWNQPATFGTDEPTLTARVGWDDHKAIDDVKVSAKMSDGGLFETRRDWSAWPEKARPPHDTAVPAVDQWPALAGMTGHVTVRPGPDVVPDTFPWRPPRPLQPKYVTEIVTDGTRFRTEDGTVLTVKRVPAGEVLLPSGRLVVADPGWLNEDPKPFAVTTRPGAYPVDIFRIAENDMTVACRVTVADAPVTSWHLAMPQGDQELALGDGEFFGNPIDTATIALVDADGVTAYPENRIRDATGRIDDGAAYSVLSDEKTSSNIVIVFGWTDGAYPTWLGRAADGSLSCYVVDFTAPDLAKATPIR